MSIFRQRCFIQHLHAADPHISIERACERLSWNVIRDRLLRWRTLMRFRAVGLPPNGKSDNSEDKEGEKTFHVD